MQGSEESTHSHASSSQSEVAVRFSSDEVLREALKFLWRNKPFQLLAGKCLQVSQSVADDLLAQFPETVVVPLVNLADLPASEAAAAHDRRMKRYLPR